ncbi:MAG: cytochrome-c oxidase, cbb3-type subunit I [Thiohalorhabdus sp.]|uniref:cytochrome-c oxidase, cbb3-type subunit I n=1 Tax=Thiohalorhabdus sp. TaxID=3094134 RepID=UPI0039815180
MAQAQAATAGQTGVNEEYNYHVIRQFAVMTLVWGIVGMFMGVFIALELAYPELMYALTGSSEFLNFNRLRPVHTSGVIFAFGGSALFATSYYVVQRTCQARLFGDKLASFTFWGWQAIIVLTVISYVLGYTQSREYAEMPWPVDILIALVWVAYFVVFIGTIMKRRQPHIYVANWFYLAFIVTTALLHIFNNLQVPIAWNSMWSYSLFSGVQDAMTQWWYGHNAVGFYLTAAFLGMMYYFVPKQAGRPVYSYRLSIIHFWALIFLYMWAGPHHLHWTALPDWVSTLGATFSIMLLMPSWGGMINGIMTLSGAWEKLRTDPIIKFMVVALSFYGMSTFEGPMMALQNVNALSHYTDWTVGHVHSGALGWVGMITFGSLYHLIPRLWNTELYSTRLANVHFWLATLGVLFYIVAMWISGILQGLMWRAFDEYGNLVYTFAESVEAMHPFYAMRAFGGILYLAGMILLTYNCYKTIAQAKAAQPATARA